MDSEDIDWSTILPEPFVGLVLGERGSGKSALTHRLMEEFHNDRDAYVMGFPEPKRDLLPEWVDILPPGVGMDEWPAHSVVVINEAHHHYHARRSGSTENVEIDKLVSISRHRDSNILYDTQQSHKLDKNSVASVDAILVRWPALMQEQFERRAVRPIIKDAREALKDYVNIHDEDDFTYVERLTDDDGVDLLKKHVYVHADTFRGEYPHEVSLPSYWTEGISRAYSDPDDSDDPDTTDTPTPGIQGTDVPVRPGGE